MKKRLYTIAASAAITSFFGLQSEADASTHKVSSGDSLWKIANKFNTSVDHLKKLNNLSSELIHPNQVLKVSGSTESSSPQTSTPPQDQGQSTVATSVYVVKSGDTLSGIAQKTGTSLSELRSLNNIQGHIIFPGQSLKTKGSGSPANNGGSTSGGSGSSNSGSTNTAIGTYIVKPGDSLSKIAYNHKTTVTKLMDLNNLSGHLIYAGQKLKVDGTSSAGSSGSSGSGQQASPPPVNTASGTYTVKSGDTLGKIAIAYKMSLSELKQINNLSSDLIRVGQTLKVKGDGGSASSPVQTTNPGNDTSSGGDVGQLLSIAQSFLGVPYVWGGASPSGFDCSGYIYYVYKQAGYDITRTNAQGQHARSHYVSNPVPGDLVFFENTYKAGISHVGIYLGNNQFIHANDGGVQITSLSNSYWNSKFESFKRFYK
ncbi:N-acetylmuramoyl-L-alanine amidase [Jeotgalibacillus malaysiensis]|uniref:N-acetylmuramoyl-L-alanine amidase n=1 Tax=Jeotgalibacillus malaysiensis TaxID=1508404 RepID=A0A0B5APY2_9BACL|nr:peptidoglycan endopeptidase [Jeotgalibacillus malaysiensis]AJD92285.1 N-acetylmuramoyl-L-alanine amidase [Jeotgalibacillus malaysiensis]